MLCALIEAQVADCLIQNNLTSTPDALVLFALKIFLTKALVGLTAYEMPERIKNSPLRKSRSRYATNNVGGERQILIRPMSSIFR